MLTRDDKSIIAFLFMFFAGATYGVIALWGSIGAFVLIIAMNLMIVALMMWYWRRNRRMAEIYYRGNEALQAIHAMGLFDYPLPPLGAHAVSPILARDLVTLVLTARPKLVVEFGSGVSTLIIASCLKKLGAGRIISLDHDAKYANISRNNLQRFGVDGHGDVIHAPLMDVNLEGKTWKWYDLSGIDGVTGIDLLIVDGPPRKIQKKSRFPALATMKARLQTNALILLDDATRPDEQQILSDWHQAYPSLERLDQLSDSDAVLMRLTSSS